MSIAMIDTFGFALPFAPDPDPQGGREKVMGAQIGRDRGFEAVVAQVSGRPRGRARKGEA